MAIKTAPGVLSVRADYKTSQATVGTEKGIPLDHAKILDALTSIGYRGEVVETMGSGLE